MLLLCAISILGRILPVRVKHGQSDRDVFPSDFDQVSFCCQVRLEVPFQVVSVQIRFPNP